MAGQISLVNRRGVLTKLASAFYHTRLSCPPFESIGCHSDGCPKAKTLKQPYWQATLPRSREATSSRLLPTVQRCGSHPHDLPEVRLLPRPDRRGARRGLADFLVA